MKTIHIIAVAFVGLVPLACGGDSPAPPTPSTADARPVEAPVPAWHDANLLPLPRPEGEHQIGVRLSEYRIEMTKERVPAGEIEFQIVNAGTTIHYLLVRDSSYYFPSRHLTPGDTTVMRVELPPGDYQYLCTIRDEFDHYSEGMSGTLVVY